MMMKPSPCHLALSALYPEDNCPACGHPAEKHRAHKSWREPEPETVRSEAESQRLRASWANGGGPQMDAAMRVETLDLVNVFDDDPVQPAAAPVTFTIECSKCHRILSKPGALVFDPPVNGTVCKYHVCVGCWDEIKGMFERG